VTFVRLLVAALVFPRVGLATKEIQVLQVEQNVGAFIAEGSPLKVSPDHRDDRAALVPRIFLAGYRCGW